MAAYDDILAIVKNQKGYVATYQVPHISSQVFVHHENAGNLERVTVDFTAQLSSRSTNTPI